MNRLWVRLALAYSLIFMYLIIVLSGLLEEDQSALNATLLAEVDYSAEEAQAVRLLIKSGKLEELFDRREIEGLGTFTLSVLIAALIDDGYSGNVLVNQTTQDAGRGGASDWGTRFGETDCGARAGRIGRLTPSHQCLHRHQSGTTTQER